MPWGGIRMGRPTLHDGRVWSLWTAILRFGFVVLELMPGPIVILLSVAMPRAVMAVYILDFGGLFNGEAQCGSFYCVAYISPQDLPF